MELRSPDGVSASLGCGLPSLGSRVVPLQTMAPSLWTSTKLGVLRAVAEGAGGGHHRILQQRDPVNCWELVEPPDSPANLFQHSFAVRVIVGVLCHALQVGSVALP